GSGPRHLRSRRGRHAAHLRVLSASLTRRLTRPRREAFLLPVDPNDRMRRGLAAAAVLAVAAFGLTTALPVTSQDNRGSAVTLATDVADRESTGSVASRSRDRAALPNSPQSPKATTSASPPTATPTAVQPPAPVGGLSQTEMDNAIAIVDVAKREN